MAFHVLNRGAAMLSDWPVERPGGWVDFVNDAQMAAELEAIRRSVKRGCRFGEEQWQTQVVRTLSLQSTLRPLGRPPRTMATEAGGPACQRSLARFLVRRIPLALDRKSVV